MACEIWPWEEGEGAKGSGRARVEIRLGAWRNWLSTALSICLSDPQERDEAVRRRLPKIAYRREPIRDPSIEGERAREPRAAHPVLTHRSPSLTLLAKVRGLRRHGVGEGEGELGADFTSLVLPRVA